VSPAVLLRRSCRCALVGLPAAILVGWTSGGPSRQTGGRGLGCPPLRAGLERSIREVCTSGALRRSSPPQSGCTATRPCSRLLLIFNAISAIMRGGVPMPSFLRGCLLLAPRTTTNLLDLDRLAGSAVWRSVLAPASRLLLFPPRHFTLCHHLASAVHSRGSPRVIRSTRYLYLFRTKRAAICAPSEECLNTDRCCSI
jgi:hypothetical protein